MKRFSRLWKRHFQTGRSGAQKARRARLAFEHLETRLVPSTLSLDNFGLLTYTAGADVANNLTVSLSGSTYSFNDTAENIRVLAGTPAAGSGSNMVTISASSVSGIVLNLGTIADRAMIRATADSLTVNAGDGDDLVTVGETGFSMDNLLAAVTVNGQGGSFDRVVVDDTSASGGPYGMRVYTVTNSSVSARVFYLEGGQDSVVNYTGLEGVGLTASPFRDIILVRSTASSAPVVIAAGAGDDSMAFGSVTNFLTALDGVVLISGK